MGGPRGVNLDPLSPPDDAVPTDAINPVYPLENILAIFLGLRAGQTALQIVEKSLRNTEWSFGKHKSATKWANQMLKRSWTEEKITETIKKGKKFPAKNKLNDNKAARYEFKNNYLVRDEETKQIIQLGGKDFKRPE